MVVSSVTIYENLLFLQLYYTVLMLTSVNGMVGNWTEMENLYQNKFLCIFPIKYHISQNDKTYKEIYY